MSENEEDEPKFAAPPFGAMFGSSLGSAVLNTSTFNSALYNQPPTQPFPIASTGNAKGEAVAQAEGSATVTDFSALVAQVEALVRRVEPLAEALDAIRANGQGYSVTEAVRQALPELSAADIIEFKIALRLVGGRANGTREPDAEADRLAAATIERVGRQIVVALSWAITLGTGVLGSLIAARLMPPGPADTLATELAQTVALLLGHFSSMIPDLLPPLN